MQGTDVQRARKDTDRRRRENEYASQEKSKSQKRREMAPPFSQPERRPPAARHVMINAIHALHVAIRKNEKKVIGGKPVGNIPDGS